MLMPQSYWKHTKKEHEKMPHRNRKKVIKHLKDDIKTFKSEAHEDRELIQDLKMPHLKGIKGLAKRKKAKRHSPSTKMGTTKRIKTK